MVMFFQGYKDIQLFIPNSKVGGCQICNITLRDIAQVYQFIQWQVRSCDGQQPLAFQR